MSVDFAYSIKRTRRKSLGAYVYPHGEVQIRVPMKAKEKEITAFVKYSEEWINRTLKALPTYTPPPQQKFCEGEQVYFLGKPLTLNLRMETKTSVLLEGETLKVGVKDIQCEEQVEQAVTDWWRHQAKQRFPLIVSEELTRIGWHKEHTPKVKVRKMKSRWGSCSSNEDITLALKLIRYPEHLIRYVVIHELCHLKEFNHSARFYTHMDTHCPTWREDKRELGESNY